MKLALAEIPKTGFVIKPIYDKSKVPAEPSISILVKTFIFPNLLYVNNEGSGTAKMCRLVLAFLANLCDKYQNFLSCLNPFHSGY